MPQNIENEDEKDAYVSQTGQTFTVFQGNTGRVLSVHTTREKAEAQVAFLHAKNKPSSSNRGANARERETQRQQEERGDRAVQRAIDQSLAKLWPKR